MAGEAPSPCQYSGRHMRYENSSVLGDPLYCGVGRGRIQLGTEPGNSAKDTVLPRALPLVPPPPAWVPAGGPDDPQAETASAAPATTAATPNHRRERAGFGVRGMATSFRVRGRSRVWSRRETPPRRRLGRRMRFGQ